jgi:chromosome partitioning protein
VGSLARGELLQHIFELIERHRAHTAISTAGPTAIADDGRLPFRVKAHLLEEVTDKAVSDWARTVRGSEAEYVIVDAPGAMGGAFGATIGRRRYCPRPLWGDCA